MEVLAMARKVRVGRTANNLYDYAIVCNNEKP